VLFYDGSNWAVYNIGIPPSEANSGFRAISGRATNDIFIAGSSGEIYHWDGDAWNLFEGRGRPVAALRTTTAGLVTVEDAERIFRAEIMRYQDGEWTLLTADLLTTSLAVLPTGEIWIGNYGGYAQHYDGSTWSRLGLVGGAIADIQLNEEEVVLATVSGILRATGSFWRSSKTGQVHDIFFRSETDMVAATNEGSLLRYDGSSWAAEVVDANNSPPLPLRSVWCASDDACFAAGVGKVAFKSTGPGEVWAPIALPGPVSSYFAIDSIAGTAATDVWFAGGHVVWGVVSTPVLQHYNGSTVTEVDLAAETGLASLGIINKIVVTGPDDLIVLANYQLLKKKADEWTATALPQRSFDLYYTSEVDIWVAARVGQVLHWDGDDWTTIQTPSFTDLRAIWVNSPDDIFAAGSSGTITHFDGQQWSVVRYPDLSSIFTLAGTRRHMHFGGVDSRELVRLRSWNCGVDEDPLTNIDDNCNGSFVE
jgi:hypothetical protein